MSTLTPREHKALSLWPKLSFFDMGIEEGSDGWFNIVTQELTPAVGDTERSTAGVLRSLAKKGYVTVGDLDKQSDGVPADRMIALTKLGADTILEIEKGTTPPPAKLKVVSTSGDQPVIDPELSAAITEANEMAAAGIEDGILRQCSIGWHSECSERRHMQGMCECPCHTMNQNLSDDTINKRLSSKDARKVSARVPKNDKPIKLKTTKAKASVLTVKAAPTVSKATSHAGHDHPSTKAARAICRRQMAKAAAAK